MLLVVDRREDLVPSPPEANPRSTERALRHMGWPFPVSGDYTVPLPPSRRSTVVPAIKAAPPEPMRTPRRPPVAMPAPVFALELA